MAVERVGNAALSNLDSLASSQTGIIGTFMEISALILVGIVGYLFKYWRWSCSGSGESMGAVKM